MIPFLGPTQPLPPVARALDEPNGLLAAGGGLSVSRLLHAYAHGAFPWFNEGDPVLWWSPDPRMVLVPAELKVSRSLRQRARRHDYRVTFDHAFAEVLTACSEPRSYEPDTWLVPSMRRAYLALFERGAAHSVEVWMDDALVGGLYGVAIGRMFFGESMFSRRTDGSKLALLTLAAHLHTWHYPLIDCQQATEHLASLGARTISRASFVTVVADQARLAPHAPWVVDPGLDPVALLAAARQTTESP